jgi:RNA polymerase sigma-70 factor (ECF subfamily)
MSDAHHDKSCLEPLVAKQAEFVGFVQKRIGRRDVAEDLVQDALAKALTRADSIRQEESVVAWFYQVLRNAIVDHFRKEGTDARTKAGFELESMVADEPEEEKRPCRCATRLVDDLKPEYADAIKRVEIEDVAVKDYAEVAGITSGNAAVRVFRARESLKKAVAKTCGKCCADGGHNYCTCGDPEPV